MTFELITKNVDNMKWKEVPLNAIIGTIFIDVKHNDAQNRIEFITNSNELYILAHKQDCSESVVIEDICGDLEDLINSPILKADESSNVDKSKSLSFNEDICSATWTFYKFATLNGYVDIRFYGESNGCYSETANLYKVTSY
jgi:hypothetical protein